METNSILSTMRTIGNSVGDISSNIIKYMSNPTPSKLVTALVFLGIAYGTIKLVEKPIKYLIIITAIVLTISLIVSVIP